MPDIEIESRLIITVQVNNAWNTAHLSDIHFFLFHMISSLMYLIFLPDRAY